MFAFPKQSEVNRVLPKTKIYSHAKAGNALQRKFVDQVEKIVWRYKLAPETINLSAKQGVNEIQVFEIHLKTNELHLDVLRTIDRTIRHPISFHLKTNGQTRFAMTPKRPSEGDASKWVIGDYFLSDWLADAAYHPQPLPVALDLFALYEQILRAHLPLAAHEGECLTKLLERLTEIQQLQREAEQLSSRINREKQFNRKVELNRKINKLKLDSLKLSNPEKIS